MKITTSTVVGRKHDVEGFVCVAPIDWVHVPLAPSQFAWENSFSAHLMDEQKLCDETLFSLLSLLEITSAWSRSFVSSHELFGVPLQMSAQVHWTSISCITVACPCVGMIPGTAHVTTFVPGFKS